MESSGHSATRCPALDVFFSIYPAGMEGGEDTDWISDGFTQNGDGTPSGGKRRLTRRKGFAFRVSNMNRPHDPGGGVGLCQGPIPRKDQITNLPLGYGKTRSNRPAWTPFESTGQTERNNVSTE